MGFRGWIGVDLDGTLAEYHGWNNGEIGAPIAPMVARVKRWLAAGRDVRIFTARVGLCGNYSEASKRVDNQAFADEQRVKITEWCVKHLGWALPVTAVKDFECIEIWDDRAVQLIPNTGIPVDPVRLDRNG